MKRIQTFGIGYCLPAAAILTAAYSLAIAFNATPWLRGPREWRWPYVIPGSVSRIWLPALLLLAYVVVVWWLDRRPFSRRQAILTLILAGLMTPLLQLGLLYLDHADVRSQLFLRTISEQSGGFFNVGAVVTDTTDFLANFAERMPGYPVHPQRHPPGVPLLFAVTRQFFDRQPGWAEAISDVLRPYQCHNLSLMNLPNAALASAIIQMLLPFWLAAIVWPLYHLGRRLYDERTALRAALLWPLIPSVALWATRWNHLYALFTLAAFLLFHLALDRRRWLLFLACGLVVSLASFFSFGNVVLVGFLGLYALVWLAAQEERPSPGWLIIGAALFLVGLSSVWLYAWLAYRLNLLAVWRTAMGTHLNLGRSYTTWLFYHLYDFFVFLGIPLFLFWLARVATAVRQWRQNRVDVLTISFALAMLLLDFSGTSQGEVARVWAFLLPLALLGAARHLPRRTPIFTGLAGLLALQLFVSNTFLRPVGTGLLDAPPPPEADASRSGEPQARWENGPILERIDVSPTAVPGQPIAIRATWNSQEQSDRPYTLFIHLLDENGNLVAQFDGMALAGKWPTTCWQRGRPFAEVYRLTPPVDAPTGLYQVQAGFYWLPTLERLPLVQPAGRINHNVDVGTIRLVEDG